MYSARQQLRHLAFIGMPSLGPCSARQYVHTSTYCDVHLPSSTMQAMFISHLSLYRWWTYSFPSLQMGTVQYLYVHSIWIEVNWRRTSIDPSSRCRIDEKEIDIQRGFQGNMKMHPKVVHFSRWWLAHWILPRCKNKICSNHFLERSYWTCAACTSSAKNSMLNVLHHSDFNGVCFWNGIL